MLRRINQLLEYTWSAWAAREAVSHMCPVAVCKFLCCCIACLRASDWERVRGPRITPRDDVDDFFPPPPPPSY